MSPTKELYSQLNSIYSDYEEQLKKIDKRLDKLGRTRSSIVVKTIRGNKYYYEQWREGKEIKCINLGRLSPGAVAEKFISRRKKNTKDTFCLRVCSKKRAAESH